MRTDFGITSYKKKKKKQKGENRVDGDVTESKNMEINDGEYKKHAMTLRIVKQLSHTLEFLLKLKPNTLYYNNKVLDF